jgi:putative hydrolase of the HAD superfamily
MPDITFIIFDMGKVLCEYDHRIRLRLLEELTGRPAEDIDRDVWGGPEENAAEAGDPATAEDYLKQFGELLRYPIDFETWADIHRQMMKPRPEMLTLARRLKAQADLALLTNNSMMLKAALPVCAPEVVKIFGEKVHVSAEFKARKPDKAVYERICDRYRHYRERSLFIDDNAQNVEGAQKAGLLAYHFENYPSLLAYLNELGFQIVDSL